MMIQVNDIYVTNPYTESSQAFKESKRVIIVEFIEQENLYLFASRSELKLRETFNRTIGKKMIKLPFGFTIFY